MFDGEACAGDGHEGVQRVFVERSRAAGDLSVVVFDCLELGGGSIIREPWRDRRKRLVDILENAGLSRVGVVPVTDDAAALWDTWIGLGGEGIVLKDRTSRYCPGARSPAWLKAKPRLVLDVHVTGGSAERIRWGHWGEAIELELSYEHPRRGDRVAITRAFRIPRDQLFELRLGQAAQIVCWELMPSGLLRHPLFLGWCG